MPRNTRSTVAPETDAPETVAPETDAPAPDQDAPETVAPEQDAPEQDAPPIIALAELARAEVIEKGARVFDTVEIAGTLAEYPHPDDPSTSYALQRERRADGSHGPIMGATITRRAVKGAAPAVNAFRYPLADVETLREVMLAHGVRVFRAE